MHAIVIEKLTKKYGNRTVLNNINLTLQEGEFYALMGPNGSGKTTLASIIASVRTATEGIIEIFGREPEAAKAMIGYIPQENFSSPLLTGRENLHYFAGLLGYSNREARPIVDELLIRVGLIGDADKRVSEYSGGMRKRLEIATVLFPNIPLLILDEPTTGLDPSARRTFLGMIQELHAKHSTILLITHIGVDAELASRVGFINDGTILIEDTPDNLITTSGLENVITLETVTRNQTIADTLRKFSERQSVFETDIGYRVFSKNADFAAPNIVRALDAIGCKAIEIEIVKPSLEDVFFHLTNKTVTEVG